MYSLLDMYTSWFVISCHLWNIPELVHRLQVCRRVDLSILLQFSSCLFGWTSTVILSLANGLRQTTKIISFNCSTLSFYKLQDFVARLFLYPEHLHLAPDDAFPSSPNLHFFKSRINKLAINFVNKKWVRRFSQLEWVKQSSYTSGIRPCHNAEIFRRNITLCFTNKCMRLL